MLAPNNSTKDDDIDQAPSAPEYTCRTYDVPVIPEPEGFSEVLAFIKTKFTTRREWSYLKCWIQLCELDWVKK